MSLRIFVPDCPNNTNLVAFPFSFCHWSSPRVMSRSNNISYVLVVASIFWKGVGARFQKQLVSFPCSLLCVIGHLRAALPNNVSCLIWLRVLLFDLSVATSQQQTWIELPLHFVTLHFCVWFPHSAGYLYVGSLRCVVRHRCARVPQQHALIYMSLVFVIGHQRLPNNKFVLPVIELSCSICVLRDIHKHTMFDLFQCVVILALCARCFSYVNLLMFGRMLLLSIFVRVHPAS